MCRRQRLELDVTMLRSEEERLGACLLVQVHVPTLSPTPFMPDKLCQSIADAKRIAAEHVLAHLPVNTHSGLSSLLLISRDTGSVRSKDDVHNRAE